ncbi:MAG: hypothetical protein J0L84_14230 [Verrucomicrobia bacterium]|nr:hypothetical protein [Verrucomicrobiota bacterium]
MKLNRAYAIGDVVEVVAPVGSTRLPPGLGPGFQVRVIRVDAPADTVEREGREWRIPFHCLRRCGVAWRAP